MRWMRSTAKVFLFAALTMMIKCTPGPEPGPGWPVVEAQQVIDGRIEYGQIVYGAEKATVEGPDHDGKDVQIDLPVGQHIKNFGAPDDNLGLCVFCSLTMAARWHHILDLADLLYWDKDENGKPRPHSKVTKGGGYPEKVEQVVKKFAPDWADRLVQYEGTDPAALDKALAEGIAVCVTYGYGERYNMQTIYHMVLLVHLDVNFAVILDNNFIGTFERMSRKEFLNRWIHPSGKGWAAFFVAPPPPPVPTN